MELFDTLTRLASRLDSQRELLSTEEATKNAVIMPIINALGYNVFDPTEVIPEFTADVGVKKGEKVDYAIVVDGEPTILIECKGINTKLDFKHASQLYRYFGVTAARFAVLTNGQHLWFYTDLDSPNQMDSKAFFKFDLNDFDARDVAELSKFGKSVFNLDNILANATELKYTQQLGAVLATEVESPSDELVKHLTSKIYDGRFTAAVCDQFRPLVKSAFRDFINERLSNRLKSALQGVSADIEAPESEADDEPQDNGIVTTAEEIEGFHIVRAILAKHIPVKRVVMRDTKSYCGVLLDDNNRKPICRLHFNGGQKYIGTFDAEKNETRNPIERLEAIYDFEEQIVGSIHAYDGSAEPASAPVE
ncbi:type I restriction endonuclease [Rhodopirellula sallentina]|uniref:Prophage Lp2 protein 6 n=1 Tax=Rhodopirellula sallentina SM41 TaxID=1263870 RepID=M5U9J8_9BACT|nr:type I restriction endonuclease [Rhodopirellula sallentina]EMI52663.1 prophage Lp2 protein 6 [Rhodopirellula sallentina SM41]